MAIKTRAYVDLREKDSPKLAKELTMSVSFRLSRTDVFMILGRDVILETDPDYPEELPLTYAEGKLSQDWAPKAKFEKRLRAILGSDGRSHLHDDMVLSEEDIRIHRPHHAKLIDDCINTNFPQINITSDDLESFEVWKEEKANNI